MTGLTSILHPTDFSETSALACAKAVELAKQCGAELTILHTYSNGALFEAAPPIPGSGYQAQDSPVYGPERRGAAITAFRRRHRRTRGRSTTDWRNESFSNQIRLAKGAPHASICHAA
jgi:hypothetical protein